MDFEDFRKFAYLRYIAQDITWKRFNKAADKFAMSGGKMQFHNYIIEQGFRDLRTLSMKSFLKTVYTNSYLMRELLARDVRIWRADMNMEEHHHD